MVVLRPETAIPLANHPSERHSLRNKQHEGNLGT
jgi:hypothetical protein